MSPDLVLAMQARLIGCTRLAPRSLTHSCIEGMLTPAVPRHGASYWGARPTASHGMCVLATK